MLFISGFHKSYEARKGFVRAVFNYFLIYRPELNLVITAVSHPFKMSSYIFPALISRSVVIILR